MEQAIADVYSRAYAASVSTGYDEVHSMVARKAVIAFIQLMREIEPTYNQISVGALPTENES